MDDQQIAQPLLLRLHHKGKQHLPALFDRTAQQIQARLRVIFPQPQFIQHTVLQPFAFKFQRGRQRQNIEIAGGEKIIELQDIETLRRARVAFRMPMNVIAALQRLNVPMAPRNSDLSSRFMCTPPAATGGYYNRRAPPPQCVCRQPATICPAGSSGKLVATLSAKLGNQRGR